MDPLDFSARQNAHHTTTSLSHLFLQEGKKLEVRLDVLNAALKQDPVLPIAMHTRQKVKP
jgi:hypothetical protein